VKAEAKKMRRRARAEAARGKQKSKTKRSRPEPSPAHEARPRPRDERATSADSERKPAVAAPVAPPRTHARTSTPRSFLVENARVLGIVLVVFLAGAVAVAAIFR
jgi:cobalamin biosynthesis Mg chelatase CobN